MNWINAIGFFAAICTTIALLPQVIKIVTTKQTEDISLLMYLVLITGVVAWLIYGIFIKDLPIIMSNTIGVLLAGYVLILKIKYG